MNDANRPVARFVTLAVWAALVSIAFAASAAARVEVHVLDRPRVLVLAHGEDRAAPRTFEPASESASDDDPMDPQIAVTNVGPPVVTIPLVTIAHESQTLSLVVKTGTTVETSSTTSLPRVEGTSETNTTTSKPDDDGGELSYTGPRGSLLWEIIIAGSMVVVGARFILGSRRRRRSFE